MTRLVVPTTHVRPVQADAWPQTRCTGGRGTDPWCPRCDPRQYPAVARHRAAS